MSHLLVEELGVGRLVSHGDAQRVEDEVQQAQQRHVPRQRGVAALQPQRAQHRLVRLGPERLPQVWGDSMALHHCLINLLDNAMKYSKDRKDVRISAREREGMVSISVADRGIGIEPEHLARVFDKFARVETGLVHTVKGAGLGLSLVDRLIRAHHGRVEVASTPGEGSIFTIFIPIWHSAERGTV